MSISLTSIFLLYSFEFLQGLVDLVGVFPNFSIPIRFLIPIIIGLAGSAGTTFRKYSLFLLCVSLRFLRCVPKVIGRNGNNINSHFIFNTNYQKFYQSFSDCTGAPFCFSAFTFSCTFRSSLFIASSKLCIC